MLKTDLYSAIKSEDSEALTVTVLLVLVAVARAVIIYNTNTKLYDTPARRSQHVRRKTLDLY